MRKQKDIEPKRRIYKFMTLVIFYNIQLPAAMAAPNTNPPTVFNAVPPLSLVVGSEVAAEPLAEGLAEVLGEGLPEVTSSAEVDPFLQGVAVLFTSTKVISAHCSV